MKVLLIHQAFTSGQEAGGTRHLELGHQLAVRGDSLTIVASQISYMTGKPVNPGRGGLCYREPPEGGVEVIRAYSPAILHKSFFWRVVAFIVFSVTSVWAGLRSGPIDLVMGTSPPIFQAFSAWLVARLRRKPFLLEIRDLWPEFAIDIGVLRNPVLKAMARAAERFLYRHADHLLVNSPAYRDYLLAKGIAAAKISYVPNGVDPDAFDPHRNGEAIRTRFGLEGKFVVVYAGAMGLANDLGTTLQAAERLLERDEIRFLLVGGGKERANLEEEARRRNLTNVIFGGVIPKAEMPDILAAADVCVATLKNIPMFAMTYPNKVFDYMAAGRPTVLGIDGVIRRVIEDASGGIFVPPGDSTAIIEAIETLRRDPELRARMGQSARDHVVRYFNRRDQAEEFRLVLYRVAGREAAVVSACESAAV